MSACKREKVKIGRTTFMARVKGSDCRKKRKDGVRRQKPHWGSKAKAAAKSRAMKNPDFKLYKNALPRANKACLKLTRPFTKTHGACIRKNLAKLVHGHR